MNRPTSLAEHRPVRSVLRFRRWSRKGYAAFVSLRHTVTIGQLAIALADRFQQKHGALHAGILRLCETVGRATHDTEAGEWLWEDENEFLLWTNGLLCAALPSDEVAHPVTDALYNIIGIERRERSSWIFPAFFHGKKSRFIKSCPFKK